MATLPSSFFIRLPFFLLDLVDSGQLQPYDERVYIRLCRLVYEKTKTFNHSNAEVSMSELSTKTGLDRHAVGRSLKRLEAHGLISVKRKHGCAPEIEISTTWGSEHQVISTTRGSEHQGVGAPSTRSHYHERNIEKDTTARSAPPPPDSDVQVKKRIFGVASALMKRMPNALIADVSDELKYELIRQGIPYDHVSVNDVLNTLLTRQAAVRRTTPHHSRTRV